MRKRALLFFLGLAAIPVARAQSIQPAVFNATGGSATVSGNNVTWSVGEMTAVATVANGNIIITQGVLQPAESPTSAASQQLITSHVYLFPNPADAFVIVQSNFPDAGDLKMVLTDVTGKVLLHQEIKLSSGMQQNELPVSGLATGSYLLQLAYESKDQHGTATYKIQKVR